MTAPTRARAPIDPRMRARRRAVAAAQARRRRRIAASVAVAVALAAGAAGLTYTPLFAVTDVAVTGAAGERAVEVESAAGVLVGERLLAVDLDAVAADVEALPWIRSAEVARQPPSTVAIDVEPREPVAVVRAGGAAWLVDAEGVVVGGGSSADLVVIDAPEAVLPGSGETVTDPAVRNALEAHSALPSELRRAVLRYDAPRAADLRAMLDGAVLTDAPADGIWVRIGTAERMAAKARVITLLLAQLDGEAGRLGGATIAELDVRAPDNPVAIPEE